MDDAAQGAFEYILLLAGILLIVVLVIVLLRGIMTGQIIPAVNQSIQKVLNATNITNSS